MFVLEKQGKTINLFNIVNRSPILLAFNKTTAVVILCHTLSVENQREHDCQSNDNFFEYKL